jgi:hypothetical protein
MLFKYESMRSIIKASSNILSLLPSFKESCLDFFFFIYYFWVATQPCLNGAPACISPSMALPAISAFFCRRALLLEEALHKKAIEGLNKRSAKKSRRREAFELCFA